MKIYHVCVCRPEISSGFLTKNHKKLWRYFKVGKILIATPMWCVWCTLLHISWYTSIFTCKHHVSTCILSNLVLILVLSQFTSKCFNSKSATHKGLAVLCKTCQICESFILKAPMQSLSVGGSIIPLTKIKPS